jgi:hypothetical protein
MSHEELVNFLQNLLGEAEEPGGNWQGRFHLEENICVAGFLNSPQTTGRDDAGHVFQEDESV